MPVHEENSRVETLMFAYKFSVFIANTKSKTVEVYAPKKIILYLTRVPAALVSGLWHSD